MSKARPKPVAKIRWTKAEKVNAAVWATEWGVTIFAVASAFAGIVATRTLPLYVFLPTTALAVVLAALSFGLKGKLRTIFDTQRRAEQENTGRFRIEELYGRPRHFAPLAPKARHALIASVENDSTQQFRPITTEEYSHS
jgi:hypothetical protein